MDKQRFEVGDIIRIVDCQRNANTGLGLASMSKFIGEATMITKVKEVKMDLNWAGFTFFYILEGNPYSWRPDWIKGINELTIVNDYFEIKDFEIL